MGLKQSATLEQYARRRFVLSGTSVVKDRFPYCRSMEELGVERANVRQAKTSFAHYDYLALASDLRIRSAAMRAIKMFGVGAGASRLVGGELAMHRDLERDFAKFIGVEDTLSLVSGYGANVALISHLLTRGDLIIVDEAVHNSIMVGTQVSRAETQTFRHNDLHHLQALLRTRSDYGRVLVVVEGLYSMDGDIPELPQLIELCRAHDAWLAVDEAHSIGVLGDTGRGVSEHFRMPASEIDLIVGTLSKAFVACGGFVGGKRAVIDWLRFTLPGFVYSVGLPPPSAAAARCALQILEAEPERLRRLRENSRHFIRAARARGLSVGTAEGMAVIPILFNDTPAAIGAANAALRAGFFVPPIVQIAVPKDAPRMRFFVTAGHERWQIDGVLDALAAYVAEVAGARASGELETANARRRADQDISGYKSAPPTHGQ